MSRPAEARLDGRSILIVEDEYFLADDLARIVTGAGGVALGPFSSAEAGLAAAKRTPPDCAILDVNLGAGADFTAARALMGRGVPIIFVTGYDAEAIPDDLKSAPCLQKPLVAHRLLTTVEALTAPTASV